MNPHGVRNKSVVRVDDHERSKIRRSVVVPQKRVVAGSLLGQKDHITQIEVMVDKPNVSKQVTDTKPPNSKGSTEKHINAELAKSAPSHVRNAIGPRGRFGGFLNRFANRVTSDLPVGIAGGSPGRAPRELLL